MKNFILQYVSDVTQSPKIAAVVSGATTTSGIATVLDWIPSGIGNFATLVGIILSVVLIITHVKRSRRDDEKHELEMELLRRDLHGK